ncbi:MAG: RNA polymerase sigma factor [Chloroflexi bacterium]|nr:RNA polymerase sigma factor [Chloroflexota bacterium]
MAKRSNQQWLKDLQSTGQAREAALADLHTILVRGLQQGLLHQINTNSPEFEALAEDFAQEASIKILDQLHTFAGRSQFTTWAHKITLHVALTELRRKRWQDQSLDGLLETDEGEYTPLIVASSTPGPAEQTERADLLAKVQHVLLHGLTEKQRTALIALVINGTSPEQIAEQMEMKTNAVYKLLHDARLRLRTLLGKEGLTPEAVLEAFEQ